MRYLRFDAKAVRVFLAQCARQLQKRLATRSDAVAVMFSNSPQSLLDTFVGSQIAVHAVALGRRMRRAFAIKANDFVLGLQPSGQC